MEKKDLKAGMMVELRDGSRYILIPNSYGLQLINVKNATNWESSLSGFNDDLTAKIEFMKNIVKVYDLSDTSPFYFINRKLLWEREPKIKLTQEEIEILKALKVLGYEKIFREEDDVEKSKSSYLTAYKELSQNCSHWLVLDTDAFKFVKQGHAQWHSIDELLKGVK